MKMVHCYDLNLHMLQMIPSPVLQGLNQLEHGIVLTSESVHDQ